MERLVVLARPARKSLSKAPAGDRRRILAAMSEMQQNPFQGDVRKLQGLPGFRRRGGNWRVFFGLILSADISWSPPSSGEHQLPIKRSQAANCDSRSLHSALGLASRSG